MLIYRYAYVTEAMFKNDNLPTETTGYYQSDNEVRNRYRSKGDELVFLKRLDYTELDVNKKDIEDSMQAGRTKNVGWSIYFDKSYNELRLLYHVEEDKDRLCGQMCCQKSDVLFTHKSSDVANKMYTELTLAHKEYKSSKPIVKQREVIQALKNEEITQSKKFAQDMVSVVADKMAEYLI